MKRVKITDFERAVIVLMARGYQAKQIAAALGITIDCVSRTKLRVRRRHRLTNDTQLGMLIERSEILSADERERIEARRQVVLKARELQ